MSNNEGTVTGKLSDKMRYVLTLALGMLVLFWRVLLPTNVELTVGIGILMLALDLVLAAAVVFLNKKELKEALTKKITWKFFLKAILVFIIGLVMAIVVAQVIVSMGMEFSDPTRLVAAEISNAFPLGAIISMLIITPVWEEIAFRMAGKKLIKNGVLFVVITSLLFAFIHTVNFSIIDNLDYLIYGIVMSVAYLIVKDVRIVIVAHFLNNLLGVLPMILAG